MAIDDRNFAVVEIHHVLHVLHNRRGVRGEEVFAFADASHERAALACRDYFIVVGAVEHCDGIDSDDLVQCRLYRLEQRAPVLRVQVFDELYEYLGVGFAAEGVAFLREHGFQYPVVFDDAVVNERYRAVLRIVGMGVHVVGLAVRGPARMGDAYRTGNILVLHEVFEFGYLSFRFVDVEFSCRIYQCDAGTVVPAVFEPVEPLYQYGVSVLASHVSYYSTHKAMSVSVKLMSCLRPFRSVPGECYASPGSGRTVAVFSIICFCRTLSVRQTKISILP